MSAATEELSRLSGSQRLAWYHEMTETDRVVFLWVCRLGHASAGYIGQCRWGDGSEDPNAYARSATRTLRRLRDRDLVAAFSPFGGADRWRTTLEGRDLYGALSMEETHRPNGPAFLRRTLPPRNPAAGG